MKRAFPHAIQCYCDGNCMEDGDVVDGLFPDNNTCIAPLGSKCFSAMQEVEDEETGLIYTQKSFGCLPPDHQGGLFQCKGDLVPHFSPTSIACCSDADFCNYRLQPMYKSFQTETSYEQTSTNGSSGVNFNTNGEVNNRTIFTIDHTTGLVILVVITLAIVCFIITATSLYLRYKRREQLATLYSGGVKGDSRDSRFPLSRNNDPTLCEFSSTGEGCGSQLNSLIERSCASGATGLPLLVQRTIAKQIDMKRCVGKGRFGEVWIGLWREEQVAVKIFDSKFESLWFRETHIYQTVMMRHENILGFIAADIQGSGGWTQMILVTEYHMFGSLSSYLHQNAFSISQMLRFCHSAAAALSHLHVEVQGTRGKPKIAHTDITCDKFLIKRDLTCVLSDFGMAVLHDSSKAASLNEPGGGGGPTCVRHRVPRYMAPELLSIAVEEQQQQGGSSSNGKSWRKTRSGGCDLWSMYAMCDVYSLALVLWEVCRKTMTCTSPSVMTCDACQLPYHEFNYIIGGNGNAGSGVDQIRQMVNVVVLKEVRPVIPQRWTQNQYMKVMSKLIEEMWCADPHARPSSLRVKKSINNLMQSNAEESKLTATCNGSPSLYCSVESAASTISSAEHDYGALDDDDGEAFTAMLKKKVELADSEQY